MNWKYLLVFASSFFLISFSVLHLNNPEDSANNTFDQAKEDIVLREIGHKIMLYSGDSTSRVLPVRKIVENEYHIRFESPFSFEPDSLVSIIHNVIIENELSQDYVVHVLDCINNEIVYGYAILKSMQNNIVPCGNRVQKENCYSIKLQFSLEPSSSLAKNYLSWGVFSLGLGLLLVGIWKFFYKKERSEKKKPILDEKLLTVGDVIFHFEEQVIEIGTEKINLTPTESNLFHVFAKAPNQIIKKTQLQKDVWNDDGALRSRSLDVFISRLRKKIQTAQGVQLVNIHGQGYKLEVED